MRWAAGRGRSPLGQERSQAPRLGPLPGDLRLTALKDALLMKSDLVLARQRAPVLRYPDSKSSVENQAGLAVGRFDHGRLEARRRYGLQLATAVSKCEKTCVEEPMERRRQRKPIR